MGKVFNNTVKEITRVAGAFAEGDFSAHIDESLNVRGDLVAVKTALNTVSKDVSHMIRESNRMMETLVQAAAEADASIDEVSSGTQQMPGQPAMSANIQRKPRTPHSRYCRRWRISLLPLRK